MNKQEYASEVEVIEVDYREKLASLKMKCVRSNNTVKTGDKVTDHMGSIIVESMAIYTACGRGLPQLAYTGEELTKSGKSFKKPRTRTIYQVNLV